MANDHVHNSNGRHSLNADRLIRLEREMIRLAERLQAVETFKDEFWSALHLQTEITQELIDAYVWQLERSAKN